MSTTTEGTTELGSMTGAYVIDPAHSRVGFVARHAMVTKVRGSFDSFEGDGYLDAEHPDRSRVQLVIAATSIDTRNADRDAHLRSNDFFDMEQYPQIRYESTTVEALGTDTYRVTGDLTIKGVTKPVSVDFELSGPVVDPSGQTRIGLEGTTTVNRKDWGVNWNAALEAGGVLVSEKITLEFEVSAVRTGDS